MHGTSSGRQVIGRTSLVLLGLFLSLNGNCFPLPGGTPCVTDDDCGADATCILSVCEPKETPKTPDSCSTDADCGSGRHCAAGQCVEDEGDGDGGDETTGIAFPEFPDDPGTTEGCETAGSGFACPIVTIMQTGGLTAEFIGTDDASGTPASIVALVSNTGSEDFRADFDDQQRVKQSTIGDLNIGYSYSQSTFDYELMQNSKLLYNGTQITQPMAGRVAGGRTPQGVAGVASCADDLIAETADMVIEGSGGADASFIDCLAEQPGLSGVSRALCAADVLVSSLSQELAECPSASDPPRCTERTETSLAAAMLFRDIQSAVLGDVVAQIHAARSKLCPGECGNGVVDAGEGCDPPGQFCDADCQSIPGCGNGFVDPGEDCDPPSACCDDDCQQISGAGIPASEIDPCNVCTNHGDTGWCNRSNDESICVVGGPEGPKSPFVECTTWVYDRPDCVACD